MDEVWVLGATGRTGRAVARQLSAAGVALVLVGRDRRRLEGVADELGGARRLVVGSLSSALAELARLGEDAPAVVVNTVGPFTATAVQVARACPSGTHYVDVANELPAVEGVLGLDAHAVAGRQVFVTAAGLGVLATESVLLRLLEGRPGPARVRVDALPAVALEAGVIGPALAATITGIVRLGGREVRHGRLVRSRTGAHYQQLTTPDGEVVGTGGGASGELIAAWRASGAEQVIAASAAAPSSAFVRAALPAVEAVFRTPGVSRLATPLLARVPLRARAMTRPFSWAHARVEWATGAAQDGWLRVGDGMDFTASVTADVTRRLLAGQGRYGAHTPGALFGPELAEANGGKFIEGGS